MTGITSTLPLRQADDDARRLAQLTGRPTHDVGVILGSGWAAAAEALGTVDAEVSMTSLAGFPAPSVRGHPGVIRSVDVGGTQALLVLGRSHLYEGHEPDKVVHGVRVAVKAGCRVVVLTNAAGGVRAGLRVGQPVLIRDHLNLTGRSPLTGAPDRYGTQFVDLTDAYAERLRVIARDVDPSLEEGVYAGLAGPHYETPAEIRMLRTLGADLVGMSTVLETIAAVHLGASVLGLSLVTNAAAGLSGTGLEHAEVLEAGRASAGRLADLLGRLLARLPA